MAASGDSGGPVFIGGAIAGITSSAGRLPEADSTDDTDASWGEVAFNMRVSAFQEFLTEATGGAEVFVLDVRGDYNASGAVDQADLDLVLFNWGTELVNPGAAGWSNDLPTGPVDQQELDKVLLNWSNVTGAAPAASDIPEPHTTALLAVALTALAIARRRANLEI
jgi:hypothetical protein